MIAMLRPRAARRAMTIVEVMIAMTVLAILMTAAVSLYIQASQHFARTSVDLDAEREARYAMGAATSELRQAMPRPGPQLAQPVISPTTPMPAATAVTFTKVDDIASAVDANGQLDMNKLDANYDTMTIHLDTSASPLPLLVEDGIDGHGNALPQRILGRDVITFLVTPQSVDTYDLKIVTAPLIRQDLLDSNNPNLHHYTLTSTVYISYFKGTQ